MNVLTPKQHDVSYCELVATRIASDTTDVLRVDIY